MHRLPLVLTAALAAALTAACSKSDDGAAKADEAKAKAVDAVDAYKKKSMATEAKVNLQRITRGLAFHRESEAAGAAALGAAPMTPAAGACCQGPGGKCVANPALWKHPTWEALDFVVEDDHRYSYEVVFAGAGFTARALGDLDCDGAFSTYELAGRLDDASQATLKIAQDLE